MLNFLFDYKKRRRPELASPNPTASTVCWKATTAASLIKGREGGRIDAPNGVGQGFMHARS